LRVPGAVAAGAGGGAHVRPLPRDHPARLRPRRAVVRRAEHRGLLAALRRLGPRATAHLRLGQARGRALPHRGPPPAPLAEEPVLLQRVRTHQGGAVLPVPARAQVQPGGARAGRGAVPGGRPRHGVRGRPAWEPAHAPGLRAHHAVEGPPAAQDDLRRLGPHARREHADCGDGPELRRRPHRRRGVPPGHDQAHGTEPRASLAVQPRAGRRVQVHAGQQLLAGLHGQRGAGRAAAGGRATRLVGGGLAGTARGGLPPQAAQRRQGAAFRLGHAHAEVRLHPASLLLPRASVAGAVQHRQHPALRGGDVGKTGRDGLNEAQYQSDDLAMYASPPPPTKYSTQPAIRVGIA
ncbi:unnamed protein product, partial [Heterosigma akashiwo]